jgi:hypothetical protein
MDPGFGTDDDSEACLTILVLWREDRVTMYLTD